MDELEIRHRILSDRELRVLGLLSLGWEDGQIGDRLAIPRNTVKTHLYRMRRKLGISRRVALALFYVDYVLPEDRLPNYLPGEKLLLWRKRAEEMRAQLKAAGVLEPEVVAAAMLLTKFEHASKTTEELGALMCDSDGKPLSGYGYRRLLGRISMYLPGSGGKVRIAVIASLAPLDAA